jgi:hypothetical protein
VLVWLVSPVGPVMICGVPVLAIEAPHPVCWLPGELREGLPPAGYGLVGPVELLADPADWLAPTFEAPNTELGFVDELGFVGPVGVPAEPPDRLAPTFELPNTELGFEGELGFVGPSRCPPSRRPNCYRCPHSGLTPCPRRRLLHPFR